MKKSYNKAFTLVELLAVIVILAIILVIAVPKIMDVINDSKKSTLETSVKMIASAAEKTKKQNTILGKNNDVIKCEDVAKLSSSDYDLDNCTITFDKNNNASVTIKGKGKFEGLNVCSGTKNEAIAQTGACATPKEYFTYGLYALNSSDVTVEDADKCANYLLPFEPTCNTSQLKELLCSMPVDSQTYGRVPISDYSNAGLKLSDNAEIGIIITDYNLEGGTEVIIPDTIDSYPVVGVKFVGNKFDSLTKITTPATLYNTWTNYTDPVSGEWIGEEVPGACPPPF